MNRRGAVGWSIAFAVALTACLAWSSLPTLQSAPLLRVGLFFLLGLAGTALTLLRPPLPWLLGAAFLLRLALLPAAVSDDVHRYLWEGKLVRHGVSPYARTADDPRLAPLRDAHWEQMNHRDRRTAYPPLAELVFAAAGAIAYHPLPLKLLFLVSDFVILLLLRDLLRARGKPLHPLGWYAFNPVALIGVAAEAHYDPLFVLALTAAWWAAEKKRPALAWIALAASVQLKVISLLLAPLFWNRASRRHAWLFPAVIAVTSLPFGRSVTNLAGAVSGFAGSGQLNDAPYLLLSHFTGWPALAPGLFLAVCLFTWVQVQRNVCPLTRGSLWILGGMIALSPVVHFWYLLWLLPLLVLRPGVPWLVLCLSQAGYFVVWHTETTQGWWGLPLPLVYAMWTPWAVAGVFELARRPAAPPGSRSSPSLQ